jgi:xylulokinase
MALVLGIDVSTTATKAVLIDETGAIAAIGVADYGYDVPRPNWSEQDPQLWWDGAAAAVRAALAAAGVDGSAVATVGLTGQMHGAVLLDDADRVLRPAILWNDQRTARECQLIRDAVGADRLIEITGNDALTGFTAPKLVWVHDNEPDIWAGTRHVLLPKDYLRLRLTGVHAMDKADGSGTILFDLAARDWSDEVLAALHIDRALMPPTYEGPAVTSTLTAEAAAATGLREGIPVVAGGGDQSANAVGVGAIAPGVVALSLGTSGVVFAATDAPLYERHGRVHAFCHAVPGRWHMMSVMLSAAGSLRWFRDALAPGVDFGELVAPAADVTAAGTGLYFLPYLTGERSPHPDPDARGAFIGLDVTHDARHMTRAVLEGVSFGLRDGLELMVEAGMARPTQIRASGGGLASPLWRQILADVLNMEIAVPDTTEGAAYGAAVLAAVGAGWFSTVDEAAAAVVSATPVAVPGPSSGAYQAQYEDFRALYPALRDWVSRALSAAADSKRWSMTRMFASASDPGNGSGALSSTAAANTSAWTV